jgi:hypothetical protein
MANWTSLLRQVAKVGLDLLQPKRQSAPAAPPAAPGRPGARSSPTADRADRIVYAPDRDGAADPGEVVWAWVPFEEDDGRGKDRPLLVVGRRGAELVGLMLSSQHDRADDRNWISVGTGDWDSQGRESFVRLDRVLEVGEHAIRREGAILDRSRFDRVATRLRTDYGWQ